MCIASSPPQPSESSRRAVALTCRCAALHGFLACAATWREGSTKRPSPARAYGEHRGKVQRRRILLGAHGAPAGGAVLPGLRPICTPISQPHGLPGYCCRLATVSGGPVVAGTAGCGRWYLRANPLRMVRRRFSPGSLPRRLKAFSLKKSAPVGEGGRSHRDTPGPNLSRQADSR